MNLSLSDKLFWVISKIALFYLSNVEKYLKNMKLKINIKEKKSVESFILASFSQTFLGIKSKPKTLASS